MAPCMPCALRRQSTPACPSYAVPPGPLAAEAAAERAARSQSRRGRSLVRKRGRSAAADADMGEAEEQPKKRIHSSKSR